MDISYFLENESKGATYIGRAINELQISVSEETTILELYSMMNGVYARAIDIMLEEWSQAQK